MASYILRDIDRELWARFREQAREDGRSVKSVMEYLISDWLENGSQVPLPKARNGQS